VQLNPPGALSIREFDDRILHAANIATEQLDGQPYTRFGQGNSNHFVYTVIKQAGGQVPDLSSRFKFGAPGLCGGWLIFTGTDCQQQLQGQP
jgi:hypothetical protein